jgi:hypothetical protein
MALLCCSQKVVLLSVADWPLTGHELLDPRVPRSI